MSPPAWHRDPRIKPNYGPPKRGFLPKSHITNVLLYENVVQDRQLTERRGRLSRQEKWSTEVLGGQKRAFIIRTILQEAQENAMGYPRPSFLPRDVARDHRHMALSHNMFCYGLKDLPMSHSLDKGMLKVIQERYLREEKERRLRESKVRVQKARAMARKMEEKTTGPPTLPEINPPGQSVYQVYRSLTEPPEGSKFAALVRQHTLGATNISEQRRQRSYRVKDSRFMGLHESLLPTLDSSRDGYRYLSSSTWDLQPMTEEERDIIRTKYMFPPIYNYESPVMDGLLQTAREKQTEGIDEEKDTGIETEAKANIEEVASAEKQH